MLCLLGLCGLADVVKNVENIFNDVRASVVAGVGALWLMCTVGTSLVVCV
jgi:hypothetical protein